MGGFKLPEGWAELTLGDLFTFKGGGTPDKKNPTYWGGGILWASVKDVKSKYLDQTIDRITEKGLKESAANLAVPGDLVILTRIVPGKVAIVKTPVAVNQDCKIAKPNSCVDIDWAYYMFLAVEREFIKRSSGTTVLGIRLNDVNKIPVKLPPLQEQRWIVAKIAALFSELDKGVESLKTAREQLKIYRQAVLKHAFEGKLTARWREENADKLEPPEQLRARIQQEPAQMANSDVSTANWPYCRVRELLLGGPSNGRSVKDQINGFPVLRLTALKGGKIDLSEKKHGAWDREAAKPFIVKAGDFLLSRGNGSKHLVGRGGIVADHKEEVAFPDTMVRLRVNPDLMLVEFFSLLWESRIIREQIEKAARTTAGIYKINQRHIEGFMVPAPGIPEQKVIVAQLEEKLSIIDQQASEVVLALSATEILRQSILKKVFSGQLVTHADFDECVLNI